MPISKIRPRGDIKNNWETVNPILQLREIGVEWETTIGEGDAKIKFGDGLTHWNDLDYAVVNNITKKIVTALAVVEEEDPELNDGEAVDTLFGKIKKKFQTIQSKITAINTLIGVFEDITIDTGGDSEQAAENITTAINLLNTGKLTTSDIYNGLDSTNAALALSALQGKNLNDAITSLNSDISTIGTIYNANFSGISVAQGEGEGSATTAAQLSVPAGTYITIFFARTDAQAASRYFLRINGTIAGYIQSATQNGQGNCAIYALTLNSSGNIMGTIAGSQALSGWQGHLIAVRVK